MGLCGLLIVLAALIAGVLDWFPRHWCDGLSAIGWALLAVDAFRRGYDLSGLVFTAFCAWDLHRWWHGGGGDGTGCRLRRLAARFQGVRRTAPTTA
ncbi:hypothetical protein ACPCK3_15080 [Streptomyces griseoincarnatus]